MKSVIRCMAMSLIGGLFLIQSSFLAAGMGDTIVQPEGLVGIWLTQKQDSKVHIFKNPDGTLSGKIIWAKAPNESYEGMEVMRGVTYHEASNTYVCPWIYSPRMNVAAKAVFSLEGDVLNAKVVKGIVTVHQVFTRVK